MSTLRLQPILGQRYWVHNKLNKKVCDGQWGQESIGNCLVADSFFRDMNVLISFEDGSTELRQKFVWLDIILITLMITTIIHSSAERFFFPVLSLGFSIIQNTFSTVEYLFACVDQPQHKWTSSYPGCDGCLTNKSFFFQATNIHVRWFGRKERSGNTYEVVPTKPLRSVTNRSNFAVRAQIICSQMASSVT